MREGDGGRAEAEGLRRPTPYAHTDGRGGAASSMALRRPPEAPRRASEAPVPKVVVDTADAVEAKDHDAGSWILLPTAHSVARARL